MENMTFYLCGLKSCGKCGVDPFGAEFVPDQGCLFDINCTEEYILTDIVEEREFWCRASLKDIKDNLVEVEAEPSRISPRQMIREGWYMVKGKKA